ncbi:MAG: pirin family protein [Vicinamibacterales bacterium]
MRKILGVYSSSRPHWVGDGFPVRTVFSSESLGRHISPFLMLDYAPPTRFEPTARPRGVGQHPHRGFETVTIAYQGELEHRDSTGAGGLIGPGDVQWMTAAAGILHEEFHSQAFTREGGTLEMAQLWVNLRAADKNAPAGYQTLLNRDIPSVDLPNNAGRVRVIAGRYAGHAGPARTFSPMEVWDVRLHDGSTTSLELPEDRSVAVIVLHGTVRIDDAQTAGDGQLVLLDQGAGQIILDASTDATLLVLSGEPIDEPVVAYGPFVMNSEGEIRQAQHDFASGRFGQIAR